MTIAIAGGPITGKTTMASELAAKHNVDVKHTDDLIELGWSESSEAASNWFDDPDAGIVEGVAVPRALRKWIARTPEEPPCDVVIFLIGPWKPLSDGQRRMSKGCKTVMDEIRPELEARGVIVNYVCIREQ